MYKKTLVIAVFLLGYSTAQSSVIEMTRPSELPKYLSEALSNCQARNDELIISWQQNMKYSFKMEDNKCSMEVEEKFTGDKLLCKLPKELLSGLSKYYEAVSKWIISGNSTEPRYTYKNKQSTMIDNLFVVEGICKRS